jgi:hypothetical protein
MIKSKRRWGIFAICVAMSLVVLVTLSLSKQKSSPYLLFWLYMGYLAIKGDLQNIYKWMKVVAIINGIGFAFILFSPEAFFNKSLGLGTKRELLSGIGVTLFVKLCILAYAHRIIYPKITTEKVPGSVLKKGYFSFVGRIRNKRLGAPILLIVIVTCLFLGSTFLFKFIDGRPKLATNFLGIKLGDDKDQVIYSLGNPDFIADVNDRDAFGGYKVYKKNEFANLPGGFKPFNAWQYAINENDFVYSYVEFDKAKEKVNSIICYVTQEPTESRLTKAASLEACKLNNLGLYDSENKVLAELGDPKKEEINNGVKVMYYPNLNMEISLAKRSVVGIRVLSPKN